MRKSKSRLIAILSACIAGAAAVAVVVVPIRLIAYFTGGYLIVFAAYLLAIAVIEYRETEP